MTTLAIIAVLVAVAVVALVAVTSLRRARQPDGVTTFQRQIKALSPEARRRVVDEVQRIDDEKKGPNDGS